MQIPIGNLYYMLCYAWDMLEFLDNKAAGSDSITNPADLLGFVLCESMRELVRKGLARDYIEKEEEIRCVRGKILLSETLQKVLHRAGKTICVTDEYCSDILINQILKSTLSNLGRVKSVSSGIRDEIQRIERGLDGVSYRVLTTADFRRVHLHRLNRHYNIPLKICELIWQQFIPSDQSGRYAFEEFERDEVKMRHVFERFVRNFYKHELGSAFEVKSEQYNWVGTSQNPADIEFLPGMRTDVSIFSDNDFVVVETKYIPDTFLTRKENSHKIRSGHLYQLMSYMQNISLARGKVPRGILLYPQVDHSLKLKFRMWGFDVQVCTVNLTQEWDLIREELLDILKIRVDALQR